MSECINKNETRLLQKAVNAIKFSEDCLATCKVSIESCEQEPLIILQGPWFLSDFVKLYQAVDNVHTNYRSSVRNNKAVEHGEFLEEDMKTPTKESNVLLEKVRHGEWRLIEEDVDGNGNNQYKCSLCEAGEIHAPFTIVPYCWKCGARMDKEKEE